jgi:hypothetical protein
MHQARSTIILCFLISAVCLYGESLQENGVYFDPGTLYLVELSEKLNEHDYHLVEDSTKAQFRGQLFFYLEKDDSLRCEIQLQKGEEPVFILDAFTTEPIEKSSVRHSVARFTIWMLILNAISAILFFVRST